MPWVSLSFLVDACLNRACHLLFSDVYVPSRGVISVDHSVCMHQVLVSGQLLLAAELHQLRSLYRLSQHLAIVLNTASYVVLLDFYQSLTGSPVEAAVFVLIQPSL